MNFITNITDWEFMDEPLYRWFLFLGALMALLFTWNAIISFMK